MLRATTPADFEEMYLIINDAAQAYRHQIPADCWHDPYMSREALRREMDSGVVFWGWEENGMLLGVMGIQDVQDVTLIRHAYVRTVHRHRGIGGLLLRHLLHITTRPVLVGTWAAASWAIRFYEKNGFQLVSAEEKNRLLRKYWSISERQIETSVVLKESGGVFAIKKALGSAFGDFIFLTWGLSFLINHLTLTPSPINYFSLPQVA
ncbi:GNAT family N-acetyltransferase [candidate division FCPU426 bacterium]|nr:GNAT family N-acetyltransferase [candidate division FCPU426 bacterium]